MNIICQRVFSLCSVSSNGCGPAQPTLLWYIQKQLWLIIIITFNSSQNFNPKRCINSYVIQLYVIYWKCQTDESAIDRIQKISCYFCYFYCFLVPKLIHWISKYNLEGEWVKLDDWSKSQRGIEIKTQLVQKYSSHIGPNSPTATVLFLFSYLHTQICKLITKANGLFKIWCYYF